MVVQKTTEMEVWGSLGGFWKTYDVGREAQAEDWGYDKKMEGSLRVFPVSDLMGWVIGCY